MRIIIIIGANNINNAQINNACDNILILLPILTFFLVGSSYPYLLFVRITYDDALQLQLTLFLFNSNSNILFRKFYL